jgi:DNA-binding HxlR family transcriptional regulator
MSEVQTHAGCAVQDALKLIGGKWKLVIIWYLQQKPHRFNELKRALGTVSTKVLSDQLSQWEQAALVTRHPMPTSPPQVEYRITQMGLALSESLANIDAWSEKYLRSTK